jgi:hypothetical protein
VHAVLVAAVIAAAYVPGPVRTALSVAPLRELGLISYGVYLYHWPIFLWLTPERTGLDGAALFAERMVLTIAAAVVSYWWIEQPILHGRRITGWRPAAVGAVAAAAIALVFVNVPSRTDSPEIVFSAVNRPADALAAAPDDARGDVRAAASASAPAARTAVQEAGLPVTGPAPAAPTPPTAPAPPPPPPVRRILVVGDSVSQTLGRGLERWGPDHDVWVMNAARFYCGISRGGRLAMTLGNTAKPCEDWETRWSRTLDRFDPDVVVALTTIWDVGPRQRDEWGPDYIQPGDPRVDQFIVDEWSRAVDTLASRGARVVWLTAPCASDPAITKTLDYANLRYLPSLMRVRPVTRIDLAGRVCPNGFFTNQIGPVAEGRPDGMHFSDPGSDWIASWLGPRLTDPALASDVLRAGRVRRT